MPKKPKTSDRALELDLLGCVLVDAEQRWQVIGQASESDFASPDIAMLWSFIGRLLAGGAEVSYAGVLKLMDAEQAKTLSAAYEAYEGSENLELRIERLRGLAQVRRYAELTRAAWAELADAQRPGEVLGAHVQRLQELVAPPASKRIYGPDQWPRRAYEAAKARREAVLAGGLPYLRFGFPLLERRAAVLPQNLVFVAAQTKSKKTMFALNMAQHLGVQTGVPTLYLNCEMSGDEIAMRVIAMAVELNAYSLRTGTSGGELEALEAWLEDLQGNQLWLTDSLYDLTSMDIAAIARRYKHMHGIKVLVLDYIQRLRDRQYSKDEEWQVLLDAAGRLKSLAQELDIIVFVLAQLTDHGDLQRARYMSIHG